MNKELKEQEDLLLRYIDEAYPSGNISKLYLEVKNSLIDKTVQSEQDRIVGVIESQRPTIISGNEITYWKDSANKFMDKIISIITNKSDINK